MLYIYNNNKMNKNNIKQLLNQKMFFTYCDNCK